MMDETNPRAVAFQLATLQQQIDRLQEIAAGGQGREKELAAKALASLRNAKVADLAQRGAEGRFGALDELIGDLRWTLYEISDLLTASYLMSPHRVEANGVVVRRNGSERRDKKLKMDNPTTQNRNYKVSNWTHLPPGDGALQHVRDAVETAQKVLRRNRRSRAPDSGGRCRASLAVQFEIL
jgi:hypothetical protein